MELTKEYEKVIIYHNQVNQLLASENKMLVRLADTEDKQFVPKKKYISDAGYDCRARLSEPLVLEPGKRACIPLGFAINIPLNHTGDLRPRSGLTKDYGIMVGYGTVDAGYTGEVKATVFNFGEESFVINPGDRIAQLVVLPLVQTSLIEGAYLEEVDNLVELERGAKGHGSSGVK